MDKKTILIIDNERGILKVLRDILTSEGYNVDTAESGREALGKFRATFYNLALIDIKLSDMDGTELLDSIYEDMPNTIKIMMTGFPSADNAIEALNKRANAYILKPFHPEKLLKLVKEKLKEQEEAEYVNQDKFSEWIEDRMRRLEKNIELSS